jgi:hypothetical protein
MDRRRIGRTSLEVSVLGFGGNALGNLYTIVDEAEARDTVLAAHETGVTYRIRAIVGEGRFTGDRLDTFGTTGVVEIPRLQDLLA